MAQDAAWPRAPVWRLGRRAELDHFDDLNTPEEKLELEDQEGEVAILPSAWFVNTTNAPRVLPIFLAHLAQRGDRAIRQMLGQPVGGAAANLRT